MSQSTYYLEDGRHLARLHCRRRRGRRAYSPTSNTASHDNHEKINSQVSFSFLYGYGAPLGGPLGRRSSAKIASRIAVLSLTFIFNLSLSSGIFIDDWKNARVCPVYKGNDRRDMGNYRPISILPMISKVFQKGVFQQLYHYLKVNSIFSKFQSGFRPLHLTVSALIQMCDDWSDHMGKGKFTGVVFLDIHKAFDSVDHSILLEKVKIYGVADRELMWFKSYRTARQQQCLINGCLSSQSNLLCGVPQGSFLGPLLFLIYINDLPNSLPPVYK